MSIDLADVVRHVGADLPYADTGVGIELKILRCDAPGGVWVIMNRFQPGVQLPKHKHTGQVEGFTLSGRWHYLEYDFWSEAGSYIHEPAGSIHTLDVPAENTSPTEVLFIIEGALLDLDDAGNVVSVNDGPGTLEAYLAMLDAAGIARPADVIVD